MDAKTLATSILKYYDAVPLVKFSGRKGYHVDVWLKEPAALDGGLEPAKAVYKCLQMKLLMGLTLPTLDSSVLGDLKRLERVPYSFHEKTGLLCQPVDLDEKPLKPEDCSIDKLRESGLSSNLVKEVASELGRTAPTVPAAPRKPAFGVRPCILAALEKPLHGGSGHLMRLAIAVEHLHGGLTVDEVVRLFENQSDFKAEKTRYFVEHAVKRGYKPLKCQTIRRLGFCLGESCSYFKP